MHVLTYLTKWIIQNNWLVIQALDYMAIVAPYSQH
jgi:hypothetical protein